MPVFVRIRVAALVATAASLGAGTASKVLGAGSVMFPTRAASTGEKPQSKLWYHDGFYWAVLDGPSGVAIYQQAGGAWQMGSFENAILTSSFGKCDVKWNGTNLFVLVYAATCQLFEYTYAAPAHTWVLTPGFPVTLPNPSGSETMVLEQDSTGRMWTTAEGGGNVNVYCSTSADHKTWSSTPVVLQTGINMDDISSVVAFGGDKIGVFWSDQNRGEFGFRIHHDGDAPGTWDPEEAVYPGSGHADDHVHLAFDSSGRVYAVTKDAHDKFAVHRRGVNGGWTTRADVAGGIGTRPILMVAEVDSKVYVLYTRWGLDINNIEYRVADIADLNFGGETLFISSAASLNNVTGIKQPLPPGNLIAAAENGGSCLWNGFGAPPGAPPVDLLAPQPRTSLAFAASPNPCKPATTIRFGLPDARSVSLALYDARGALVASLLDGPQSAGEHETRWLGRTRAGTRAASGVYFLVLHAGDQAAIEKLLLEH